MTDLQFSAVCEAKSENHETGALITATKATCCTVFSAELGCVVSSALLALIKVHNMAAPSGLDQESLDVEQLIQDTEHHLMNPASRAADQGIPAQHDNHPTVGVSSQASPGDAQAVRKSKAAFGTSQDSIESEMTARSMTDHHSSQVVPIGVEDSPASGPQAKSAPVEDMSPSPAQTAGAGTLRKKAPAVHVADVELAAKLLAAASKVREQRIRGGISRRSHSDDDDGPSSSSCSGNLRARQRRIKALVLDGKAFGETERFCRSLFVFMLYASTVSRSHF